MQLTLIVAVSRECDQLTRKCYRGVAPPPVPSDHVIRRQITAPSSDSPVGGEFYRFIGTCDLATHRRFSHSESLQNRLMLEYEHQATLTQKLFECLNSLQDQMNQALIEILVV